MPSGFDATALKYDANFTFSNIGKAQRAFVYKNLDSIISKGRKLSILELNCGTGVDAIYLAEKGHAIIATDISEGMIKVAKSKAYPEHLSFQVLDTNAITETTFNNKKFDLIFSNFGGLNCLSISQLDAFLKTSPQLLKPNGKMVLVLMPKQCLWERMFFSLKDDIKKAKRRNTNAHLSVSVNGVSVNTWYYNPKEIISLTKELFAPTKIKPIGIAIPPSYLEHSFVAKKPFLDALKGLEKLLGQSFWAKYADHFLIELTKR